MRVLALLVWITAAHGLEATWVRNPGPEILSECNHGSDIQVFAVNGKLEIAPRKEPPPVDDVAKKFGGAHHVRIGAIDVVGIDRGEFGGGLGFVKAARLQMALAENVQGFMTVEEQVFALTGLAHLGSQTGKIWSCREVGGELRVVPVTMLPGTPCLWAIQKTSVLVLTSSALVSLQTGLDGSLDEMVVHNNDGFWGALYPNSMVQIGDEFYVGARSCLLRFPLPKAGQQTVIELSQIK